MNDSIMKNFDLNTTRDCVALVLQFRFMCRRIIQSMDDDHAANRRDRRQARKLRETKNPLLARRADTLEREADSRSKALMWVDRELLLKHGRELMQYARFIDAAVPQSLLLDLLNVNRADRHMVSPEDGITEIAFQKGLEDSAMYRGSDSKEGPLAQAVIWYMTHELTHNEQLKRAADEHLFGKGGMFEFVPVYQRASSGEMVRQPPKLRLADVCDVREG